MKVHELVSDDLWATIEPLLPPHPPHPQGGRPWVSDRAALCGIIYVLKTGIQWRMLPAELGCGSGVTCWRRLRDWQDAGVWQALHLALLDRLGEAGRIDWSRACADSASVRAKGGGQATGKNPTDRGKPGSKHHLVTERQGLPLAAGLTGADRPDETVFEPLVEGIAPIKQPNGRRRKRPKKFHADKGYDVRRCRRYLRRRGIACRIARKGVESKTKLGRHRWVVERTLAWLHSNRRLAIRYERLEAIHQAFLDLGCALICHNCLQAA
ncbi:MAG TPA: IS5 family transposase [Thermomicrobiales bacterium]|nr:IS5 family transposase [Thermomicrobiales bacterium]